jgi:hypothetical protein
MAKVTASQAINHEILADLAQVKNGDGGALQRDPTTIDYAFQYGDRLRATSAG